MANLGGSLTFGWNSDLCSSVPSRRANNPRKDRCSDLQPAFCNLPSCLRLAKTALKFTRYGYKVCRRGSGVVLGKISKRKNSFNYSAETAVLLPYHNCINSGVMTMISLPLNVWILSLEDDDSHQELRKMLCSIHVVVRILKSINIYLTILATFLQPLF